MPNLALLGLGVGFLLMGAGLFALTVRKTKPTAAAPSAKQLREQAALAHETKKMRVAAGLIGGFGAVLLLLGIF